MVLFPIRIPVPVSVLGLSLIAVRFLRFLTFLCTFFSVGTMNVTAQYPAAMQSPTRARGPREFDDVPFRGKQARFDNHDDFYAFLESNRGPGGVNTGLPPQAQNSPQSQQQRNVQTGPHSSPGDQSRPPVSNTFQPPQRSGSNRSRPPSYSGSRSEELLVDRHSDSSNKNGENNHKVQRQNGRRGGGRPPTAGGPSGGSPARTAGSSPQRQQDPARPTSSGSSNLDSAGAAIQRLKSPSVMTCVLQPLDQKVKEYNGLMHKEQDEMARLDEEIRLLQERRSQAEMRFLDAKSKHDDYRRQYEDVERAMRGEISAQREPPQRPMVQRPMSIRDEDEDFDDEEYEPQPVHRRVQSQQSFGRTSQKGGFGARFRSSIFGGR
ncbi:hypothetical protein SCUP234_00143 [Seiridium cupressi]